MIRAHCCTNLDGYNGIDWPTLFCALPRKGDIVESMDGTRYLYVTRVYHMQDSEGPYIKVELTRAVLDY